MCLHRQKEVDGRALFPPFRPTRGSPVSVRGPQGRVDWETETWGSIGADGLAVSFVVGSVTVLPQEARP